MTAVQNDLFIVEQLVRITANQLKSELSFFANSETVWYISQTQGHTHYRRHHVPCRAGSRLGCAEVILLDTHIWVRWAEPDTDPLPVAISRMIDSSDQVTVSAVSCWEVWPIWPSVTE